MREGGSEGESEGGASISLARFLRRRLFKTGVKSRPAFIS